MFAVEGAGQLIMLLVNVTGSSTGNVKKTNINYQ